VKDRRVEDIDGVALTLEIDSKQALSISRTHRKRPGDSSGESPDDLARLARGTIAEGEAMSRVKRAVLDLVKTLPDNCTLEDVQYQLYVRQKVERSMQAAAEGRVQSHEQVTKRLSKWLGR